MTSTFFLEVEVQIYIHQHLHVLKEKKEIENNITMEILKVDEMKPTQKDKKEFILLKATWRRIQITKVVEI